MCEYIKKKKIGIVTLIGYDNYGNRLQNYAIQETVKTLGYNAETLVITDILNKITFINKLRKRISNLGNISFLGIYKRLKRKLHFYLHRELLRNRQYIFLNFVNNYINEVNMNAKDLTVAINNYDFFITGSDQVWNPFYNGFSSIYFLEFAPKEKRIAYAPSFGIPKIPAVYKEKYKKWIMEIPYLSVREESGAKIIKELTGRDVPVLVDPTLMLTREKWLSIAKEDPYKPDKPYLLTYFLGEIPKGTRKRIKKIARDYNLEIVRLADTRDKKRYIAGPGEFIDYINSADLVCTDSFHGSVFSILMETPFIVFDRVGTSMYSRIETLLNKFNLHSRQANYIKDDEIFNIDFSHIPPILDEERKKALNYLKEALNVKDNN